ncbi:hypothetical protein ACFWJY_40655, partial [Streptomyces anulatus]|uniref:hypothetical protein n=1 Tax=Streptomyces anulatus TaxID=1892 RepID=UPI003666A39E
MTDPVGKLPSELDQLPDRDPEETAEWAASLDAVTQAAGPHRAAYLMRRSLQHAELPDGSSLIISPPQEPPSEHPESPGSWLVT